MVARIPFMEHRSATIIITRGDASAFLFPFSSFPLFRPFLSFFFLFFFFFFFCLFGNSCLPFLPFSPPPPFPLFLLSSLLLPPPCLFPRFRPSYRFLMHGSGSVLSAAVLLRDRVPISGVSCSSSVRPFFPCPSPRFLMHASGSVLSAAVLLRGRVP